LKRANYFLYGLSQPKVEATISFINPEINLDSRLLLIRWKSLIQTKTRNAAMTKLTQSNRKGLFIPIDAVIREENPSI
jgi:Cu(I)/Ag(I) efflux system membrane fusion protein